MESRHRIPRARFEQLVRDHHAAVYRSALRVLQNAADAEDATQRVFVRVIEGRLELERASEPRAVLRWMAVREALGLRRESDNRRRREEGHAMQRSDATDEIEARDRERAVRAELARLPEELRLPLVLRFQEELTFERIGEALGISEPGAHERVQRGLERLRAGLERAGLAGVVALDALDVLVRDETIALPHGLEARLFALHHGALASLAASPLAWTALAAVAAAGVWIARPLLAPQRGSSDDTALHALAPVANEHGERSPALSSPGSGAETGARRAESPATAPVAAARAATASTGTIAGRALDLEGAPVASAIVFAESTELEGKFPRFVRETKSDGAGRFALVVPVASDAGQEYRLGATCAGFVCRRAETTLRVDAGAALGERLVELAPITGDRAGAFALAVRVEGDDGRPIEKAAVALSRELSTSDGSPLREWEAGGLTDSAGTLRLEGARLGRKHVRVDAVGQGWRAHEEQVGVEDEGVHELVVRLQRGLSIAGELRDVDGRRVEGVELFVSAPGTVEFRGARVEGPGLFRFIGLDPGEYVLSLGPSPLWSHVALEHVAAGSEDVRITLKRADDTSDRGDHLAELHGVFVDDASGAPVPALEDALELHAVPPGTTATQLRELLVAWLEPSLAQRAGGFDGEPAPASDFHLTGLPDAEYVAVARVDGYAPRIVGPLALGERRIARDVEVRLHRGARVTGRVLDPDGQPLAGAGVILCAPAPDCAMRVAECDRQIAASNGVGTLYFAHALTDDAGRFTLERVSCDIELSLAVLHTDFEPVRGARLELADGAALETGDLRFARRRVR